MCKSIADGGHRCPGYRNIMRSGAFARLDAANREMAEITGRLNEAKAQNAPARVIDRLNAMAIESGGIIAAAKIKSDEAQGKWERTLAGIQHLESIAANEDEKPLVREQARLKAERYTKERKAQLDAAHARRNRDNDLATRLRNRGVPKVVRDKILAMTPDSTYHNLYVVPSKKAKAQLLQAEDNRDLVKEEAGKRANAVLARLIADAEAAGTPIDKAQAKQHPYCREVMRQGYVSIAQARDAYNEARARYYESPAGVGELKRELTTAEAKAAAVSAKLDALSDPRALDQDPHLVKFRQDTLSAINKRRGEVSLKAKWAIDKAERDGDKAGAQRLRRQRAQALAELERHASPEAVDALVLDEAKKAHAPLYAEALKHQRAVAQLRNEVKHYSALKDLATDNKTLRVARETAICNAVLDAGGTRKDADEEVRQYRRDRRNVSRRHGGQAPMDPNHVKNVSVGLYLTAPDYAQLERDAKAETEATGKHVSVGMLVERRITGSPHSNYKASLGMTVADAEADIRSNGRPHRQWTAPSQGRREVLLVVSTSQAAKARLKTLAGHTYDTTVSSYARHMALGEDPRKFQNDRSLVNREKKEAHMWKEHATVDQSLMNTPA